MKRFIAEHEAVVERALAGGAVTEALRSYHERQIGYLQAERLAHLLVTLAFGLFALVAGFASAWSGSVSLVAVLVLLLALLVAYVGHYYRLENAVQRWYRLARRLERALGYLPSGSEPGFWG